MPALATLTFPWIWCGSNSEIIFVKTDRFSTNLSDWHRFKVWRAPSCPTLNRLSPPPSEVWGAMSDQEDETCEQGCSPATPCCQQCNPDFETESDTDSEDESEDESGGDHDSDESGTDSDVDTSDDDSNGDVHHNLHHHLHYNDFRQQHHHYHPPPQLLQHPGGHPGAPHGCSITPCSISWLSCYPTSSSTPQPPSPGLPWGLSWGRPRGLQSSETAKKRGSAFQWESSKCEVWAAWQQKSPHSVTKPAAITLGSGLTTSCLALSLVVSARPNLPSRCHQSTPVPACQYTPPPPPLLCRSAAPCAASQSTPPVLQKN